jgi:5-methylthioadenosine/S-adenosylhomocysteine deaminase
MAVLQRLTAPVALSCAPGFPIVRDAVLDVDDTGRIAWFGPAASAPATDAVVRPLPGLLMPGLVNTHCHTPMSLLRGMGGDLPLMPWLTDVMWPAEGLLTEDDVHAGMVAGCLDLLRTGCTTSVEMYFYTDALIDAVRTAGSRAVLTPGIIAAPGWDRLGTWEQMRDDVSARIDAHGLVPDADARIELGYGPHSAYTLPPGALESVSAAARERGALVHTHVAESRGEDTAVRDSHGSVPAMLDAGGALGGRILAAHSVHLSDDDIDTYARHGVAVAHCPGSNAKLAAGTARLLDLRRAGVPVGLGTDGPASCDDLDLWHQARLAGLMARVGADDAAALTAADVLLMGTADAAHAIGRDDLGVLEAGRWADVVHVDTDDSAFVAPEDDSQLVSNLVWAGGSRLVRDVWVGGEQVVDGGEPTMADRRESLAAVRTISARLREALAR